MADEREWAEVGARIAASRRGHGLSQDDLAAEMGLDRTAEALLIEQRVARAFAVAPTAWIGRLETGRPVGGETLHTARR